MLKRLGMILLAISLSGLLSSCLVKKEKVPNIKTYTSTTDTLRLYQPGDRIDYQVQIDNADSGRQVGTMTILWESTPNLSDPFDPITHPVLKETTTLTIEGNEEILVRYIEQDTPNHSKYLRAFDAPVANQYLWLSATNAPADTVDKFENLDSPMVVAGQLALGDFYIVGDCNGTNCTTRETHSFNRTFQVTAMNQTVETPAGNFEKTYKARHMATTNREATGPLSDILDVCGDAGEANSHDAILDVVPEIGIVKIVNTCTNLTAGGSPTFYTISMESTNIDY